MQKIFFCRCHGDRNCGGVAVSDCEDGSPIDIIDALDIAMCNDLCNASPDCNYFRYDKTSATENCELFDSNYRDTCKTVAALIVSMIQF